MIRWLALFPNPVTGLDEPVAGPDGQPWTWMAPNREYAIRLAKRDLTPAQMRLVAVVSVVDWESRKQERQRPKLLEDGVARQLGFRPRNPARRCLTCGEPVRQTANYCQAHRSLKRRAAYRAAG
jgi:hypothetical protein